MPRGARLDVPGTLHHVICLGANDASRNSVFFVLIGLMFFLINESVLSYCVYGTTSPNPIMHYEQLSAH